VNISKIAYVTGSRADYGIVRKYLKMLDADSSVDLEILVTGALLEESYGRAVDLVIEDGFKIGGIVPISLPCQGIEDLATGIAQGFIGFAPILIEKNYDLVIVLGDRYEIFPVVFLSASMSIPVLHIHGGEATYANYDEFIRHSITKMARYHFAATEVYKKRIIQLGEHPSYVYNLGSLGAENCINDLGSDLSFPYDKKTYFVVLFHPETISGIDPLVQTKELLQAFEMINTLKLVFIGSNADTHGDVVRNCVRDFVQSHDNAKYIENLKPNDFHELLRGSLGLIGNSSSGLIEAPSLKIPTINIGDRQAGRVRGSSVIDVEANSDAIVEAIERVMNHEEFDYANPYYQSNCAASYYNTTKEILNGLREDVLNPKVFYDVDFSY
jgi:UDP-N-acetylglucosamine 2-epimerase (non-hydrolysing)